MHRKPRGTLRWFRRPYYMFVDHGSGHLAGACRAVKNIQRTDIPQHDAWARWANGSQLPRPTIRFGLPRWPQRLREFFAGFGGHSGVPRVTRGSHWFEWMGRPAACSGTCGAAVRGGRRSCWGWGRASHRARAGGRPSPPCTAPPPATCPGRLPPLAARVERHPPPMMAGTQSPGAQGAFGTFGHLGCHDTVADTASKKAAGPTCHWFSPGEK